VQMELERVKHQLRDPEVPKIPPEDGGRARLEILRDHARRVGLEKMKSISRRQKGPRGRGRSPRI